MATKVMTLREWTKATGGTRADQRRVNGPSPGGVAAELGVTRQAVHKAIDRGDLDAVRIIGDDGKLRAICITEASLERYRALREIREAG